MSPAFFQLLISQSTFSAPPHFKTYRGPYSAVRQEQKGPGRDRQTEQRALKTFQPENSSTKYNVQPFILFTCVN